MPTEKDGVADNSAVDDVFARNEAAPPAADKAAEGALRDEAGRFAARPQPEATATQGEAPAEQLPVERDPNTGRMIPLPELLSERQKRQEAERREAEYKAKVDAYERSFQAQRPQPQAAAPVAPPDPFADPEGFARFQGERMEARFRDRIANMSEAIARRTHGNEIVSKAQQWALQTPGAAQYFLESHDPYGELIETFKRQEAMSRIGPDPDAYEKRIREEERQKVLAELKSGTSGQPRPAFPGTLAGATQAGRAGAVVSPQAAADGVFARPGG